MARRTGSGRNGADLDTYVAHTLKAEGFDASEDGTGRGIPIAFTTQQEPKNNGDGVAFTLTKDSPSGGGQQQCVAYSELSPTLCKSGAGVARTGGKNAEPEFFVGPVVRRLTPEECESLQAFPQGYTAIQYRGKPAADGPRYRALGNSMTTSIPAWIGDRIQILEELLAEDESAA